MITPCLTQPNTVQQRMAVDQDQTTPKSTYLGSLQPKKRPRQGSSPSATQPGLHWKPFLSEKYEVKNTTNGDPNIKQLKFSEYMWTEKEMATSRI